MGTEVCGTVAAVGDDVAALAVGNRVAGNPAVGTAGVQADDAGQRVRPLTPAQVDDVKRRYPAG